VIGTYEELYTSFFLFDQYAASLELKIERIAHGGGVCCSGGLMGGVVERFTHSPMFCEMRPLHDSLLSLLIDRVVLLFTGFPRHTQ